MNPRERTLAALVGSLLALAGLWFAIQWGIINRWRTLDAKIAKARSDTKKVSRSLETAKAAEVDWSALRPLAHNPDRAENAFRQDISQLLDRHGFQDDMTIRTLPHRKLKNEFTEVRLSIQARGHLQQVVDFLCDFYERDYLVRLDQINLTAEEKSSAAARTAASAGTTRTTDRTSRSRRSSRAATTVARDDPGYGPEGPLLNINIAATALVLPELKIGGRDVPQPTALEVDQGDSETIERLPRPRDEYARIWETNIFKLYQERPPPPPPPVDPPPVADAEPKREEKPVPVPPPPRPNKYVTVVNSNSPHLAAYVRDRDHLENPLEKYTINDEVDDGTLVLVVPQGMVIQVQDRGVLKYYFYKLGANFDQREELDAVDYPEIQELLERAIGNDRARASGPGEHDKRGAGSRGG